MSTIAFFEELPVPVGLLLFSGSEPVEPTPARDCIFMVLPIASPSQSGAFFSERKHQEFSVAVTSVPNGLHISGECGPDEVLQIQIEKVGQGRWAIVTPSLAELSGRCAWA